MATQRKQFPIGMVLGKFYPFHNGHAYLIDAARQQCDLVHVFVCTMPTERYKGEDRYRWVCDHYKNDSGVNVIHVNEVLPQTPEECPWQQDFWNTWVNVVTKRIPDLNALFTSEDYGNRFAKELGVVHVLVDRERVRIPTSGTACRSDIFAHWEYLPQSVRNHFQRRICLIGPESTGKSTIAQRLAKEFQAPYVEEFGRTYTDLNPTMGLTSRDFEAIAYGQILNEEEAVTQSRGLVICDTDPMTTRVFYHLYSECGTTVFDADTDAYLKALADRHYDLYLLLDPSVPHVQDGQRDFAAIRDINFDMIRQAVIESGQPFITIKGNSYEERYNQAALWVQTIIDLVK
jgi:HTH-type transcriptional repressor of NAD biosynthesis genes